MTSFTTPLLATHHIQSPTQNSLQGALSGDNQSPVSVALVGAANSSATTQKPHLNALNQGQSHLGLSLDEEMQRQLQDYNRSVTIIIWYKAEREPIRLQHMNPTFPYFQLLQLPSVIADFGLTPSSYLDAYDHQSGKWEQHTIATVRIVVSQQRLLYRTRKTLLEGLSDVECPGLQEEISKQTGTPSSFSPPTPEIQSVLAKRPASEVTLSKTPASKVHIPNHFYNEASTSPITSTALSRSPPPPQSSVKSPPLAYNAVPNAPGPSSMDPTYIMSSKTPVPVASPLETVLSPANSPILPLHLQRPNSGTVQPIPHHPHPPLKRWPNDYTVSELTSGFHTMEALMRQPPGSGSPAITQKAAFERVFGSRYVKSTVCRHRGVWRKAEGTALRAQFEAMGAVERACWGEFVKQIEGRVSTIDVKAGNASTEEGSSTLSVGSFRPMSIAPRTSEGIVADQPLTASLQNPSHNNT